MRLTLVSLVIVMLAAAIPLSVADARPRTADDDALIEKLLGHADAIATILEKDLERPKQGLAALDRYMKKRRKPIKQLFTKLTAAVHELDDDARSALARELMFSERTQRFLAAVGAFREKHGGDPTYQKRIDARMEELTGEGRPLVDALMK